MSQIHRVSRAYWDAEESRDLDRILSFFTDDITWEAPGLRATSREELAPFYAASAAAYPRLRVTIGRVLGGDQEASLEWRAVFTAPDGLNVPARGVNVMRLRDGKISALDCYMDPNQVAPDQARSRRGPR